MSLLVPGLLTLFGVGVLVLGREGSGTATPKMTDPLQIAPGTRFEADLSQNQAVPADVRGPGQVLEVIRNPGNGIIYARHVRTAALVEVTVGRVTRVF